MISTILTLALCASLAGCGGTGGPAASTPAESAAVPEPAVEELQAARNLGLPLPHDPAEPDGLISFQEYKTLLDNLVELCDPGALSDWRASVSAGAFPKRDPRRDDGSNLLLMAARVLDYDVYNAREYIICTEYEVDYDRMDRQMSWDHPYCDMEQPILLLPRARRTGRPAGQCAVGRDVLDAAADGPPTAAATGTMGNPPRRPGPR